MFVWAEVVWVLLTWRATTEHVFYGAAVAALAGWALPPLGRVARPWRLLDPRRLGRLAVIAATSLGRVVAANVALARRVWAPSRPIRTGMLVVPTDVRADGALAALGLISSVVVDHQLVDLEPGHLQYHAIAVTSEDPIANRERINGSLERRIVAFDPAADG